MFENAVSPLAVVAHPDDETIGLGGQLTRLRNPRVVVVTDGAPRNGADARRLGFRSVREYAAARKLELCRAMSLAGIGRDLVDSFDIADQEVSSSLRELVLRLTRYFDAHRPDLVLTHPYEGGHPDHDATAFAVRAASRLSVRAPLLVEFTSYHAGPGGVVTGNFLPSPGCEVRTACLSQEDRARKRRMLVCYRSQQEMLSLFHVDTERFRSAPDYDFTRPPHPGVLHYERCAWGITGERWRSLAARASEELCASMS